MLVRRTARHRAPASSRPRSPRRTRRCTQGFTRGGAGTRKPVAIADGGANRRLGRPRTARADSLPPPRRGARTSGAGAAAGGRCRPGRRGPVARPGTGREDPADRQHAAVRRAQGHDDQAGVDDARDARGAGDGAQLLTSPSAADRNRAFRLGRVLAALADDRGRITTARRALAAAPSRRGVRRRPASGCRSPGREDGVAGEMRRTGACGRGDNRRRSRGGTRAARRRSRGVSATTPLPIRHHWRRRCTGCTNVSPAISNATATR